MAAERESVCLPRGKLQRWNGMYPTQLSSRKPRSLLPTVLGLGNGRPLWQTVRLVYAAKGTG
jgi:hypothetical protein